MHLPKPKVLEFLMSIGARPVRAELGEKSDWAHWWAVVDPERNAPPLVLILDGPGGYVEEIGAEVQRYRELCAHFGVYRWFEDDRGWYVQTRVFLAQGSTTIVDRQRIDCPREDPLWRELACAFLFLPTPGVPAPKVRKPTGAARKQRPEDSGDGDGAPSNG